MQTAHDASPRFDVIDVLTRADGDRTGAAAAVGEAIDSLDALLVSDVLRHCARVGSAQADLPTLVASCALTRSVDAFLQQLIDVHDLRNGLMMHARRTDEFMDFGAARVTLRTMCEVLQHADASPAACRHQLALLDAHLREWLITELTGSATAAMPSADPPTSAASALDSWRVTDAETARTLHDLVDEVLHGAQGYPATGLLGTAWRRGWSAVPLVGDMFGDEDAGEAARLANAIGVLDDAPTSAALINMHSEPSWHLDRRAMIIGDGLRASWLLPPAGDALQLAAASSQRRGWAMLSTPELHFALVERSGYHALLGPRRFVEAACGAPPLEIVARFRQYVDELDADDDGEAPTELLEVATRFGRLRRRAR